MTKPYRIDYTTNRMPLLACCVITMMMLTTMMSEVRALSMSKKSASKSNIITTPSPTPHNERGGVSTRKDAIMQGFGVMVGVAATSAFGLTCNPLGVMATAGTPPTKEELERIKTGYKQIQYLLDNFEQETTTCRENGGECKRDAEPIRRVLGLRSTTDPLFQIEKVFNKVKYMDGVDLEAFFEASEDWNSAMTLSNSMAFISQFGEYNPGGGKDEVLKYLNESKKAVIQAESSLKRIMDALNIQA